MRISAAQVYRAQLESLRRSSGEAFAAERRAASGLQLEVPSDDPSGSQRATMLHAMQSDVEVAREKMGRASSELATAEGAIGSMGNILTRMRELAVQMANGTLGEEERSNAATEVEMLKSSVISLANVRFGEKRLFAGQMTNIDPFAADGAYQGNSAAVSISLPQGASVGVTLAGDALLRGADGGPDVIDSINALVTALQANDGDAVAATLDGLDESASHLIEQRVLLGSRQGLVERLDRHFELAAVTVLDEISGIEDADALEAFSDLTRTRAAYEAAVQVTVAAQRLDIFALI